MTRVIFLHGGPGLDHYYLSSYFESLSEFGLSPVFYTQGSTGADTIGGLVLELKDLIDSKNDKPVLFGHSFGSTLALEYIRRFGESNLKAVIFCSWLHDVKHWLDDYLRRFQISPKDLSQSGFDSDEDYKSSTLAISNQYFCKSHQKIGKNLWEQTRFNAHLYTQIRHEFLDDFDASDVVSSLQLPVLSLAGTEDQIIGLKHIHQALKLNSKIKNIEIANAGHFPFVEQTQSVLDAVFKFTSTL